MTRSMKALTSVGNFPFETVKSFEVTKTFLANFSIPELREEILEGCRWITGILYLLRRL